MTTTPCPHSCDHTDAEHEAFDAGLEAGRTIGETAKNPYRKSDDLWWDWADGCAYGAILKESGEVAELRQLFEKESVQ